MAQHDYVIANGTGAAVRSDLNAGFAAIVSQNSGATAPSTTYAYQSWADTSAGVMKMRNGANNAWITLYQLDGEWNTIAFENGTAAAPSIYFKDSGTDTGIYSPGTDQVAISTGGTSRLAVSTTAVSSTLAVDHPLGAVGTPSITFTGDLNTGIWSPTADTIAFSKGGAEAMRINSAGSLLVNATSVAGVATARSYIYSSVAASSNVSTYANQNTTLHVRYQAGTNDEGASSALVMQLENMAGTTKPQLLRGYNSADGLVLNADYRGALTNFGNSYGAISDIRVKQDIINATSAWADIKQVQVRKYRIKGEVDSFGDDADVYLGVVAQEIEQVSPGLVVTPADYDEDPEAIKSVKYSVLYMKAVKALQEAMERIETLEAKVAALEAQ